MPELDATDARLLLELSEKPRASGVELAQSLGLARNTVQSRLAKWDTGDRLGSIDRRVNPSALGYPLLAFVTIRVDQHRLSAVTTALAGIPEVVEVFGLSGASDLLVRIVAVDANDLYRIAGLILDIAGVERTNMAIAMRELVTYRLTPVLERAAGTA
ncbi:Lrp/AsnC family transcriptional regulator [Actinomycetes bacterium M1A6_2h]